MKRKKKKYLLLTILAVSIGFAALSAQIGIFGDAHFIGGKFDVHFNNLVIIDSVEGPYNAEITSQNSTNDSISFEVQLEPDDSFAFTFDVANDGNFNADLQSYYIGAYSEGEEVDFPSFINYELYFTENGYGIGIGEVFNKQSSRNITVRLTYNTDVDYIPEENMNYTFQLSFYFEKTDQTYTPPEPDPDPNPDFTCQLVNEIHNYGTCYSDAGCIEAGYAEGDEMYYGIENSNYELIPGALIRCNNSYTSQDFIYVSDYYDTEANEFNSDYATLMSIQNVSYLEYEGVPYNNGESGDYSIKPTAYLPIGYLPDPGNWGSSNLYTNIRMLRTNNGNQYFNENEAPIYTYYYDRVARLLTTQEVERACGITVGSETVGELDSCQFLMTLTDFYDVMRRPYWLETGVDGDENSAFAIDGATRSVKKVNVTNGSYSVRPVIEIPKSNILNANY